MGNFCKDNVKLVCEYVEQTDTFVIKQTPRKKFLLQLRKVKENQYNNNLNG